MVLCVSLFYKYSFIKQYEIPKKENFGKYLKKKNIYCIFFFFQTTRKYAKAETLMTVTDAVHDIAFAPNLGRSFHVLAIATKDVRIFKLVPMR